MSGWQNFAADGSLLTAIASIPSHAHSGAGAGGQLNAGNVFSAGQVKLDYGGTESDLGATGPGVVVQATTGAALTIVGFNNTAVFQEQQTSGTSGGTFTSGADRTRTLNTEVTDPGGIASLSSNQITITNAGTYLITWWATAFAVDGHQTILRDITGGADYIRGQTMFSGNAVSGEGSSSGSYVLVLTASRIIELRHVCGTTKATNGFGLANSLGTEVFSQVTITKIA